MLPWELQEVKKAFETFYQKEFKSGRKLKWITAHGNAVLRANFQESKQRKEIVCSTYQMCILLLYNNRVQFRVKQLVQLS